MCSEDYVECKCASTRISEPSIIFGNVLRPQQHVNAASTYLFVLGTTHLPDRRVANRIGAALSPEGPDGAFEHAAAPPWCAFFAWHYGPSASLIYVTLRPATSRRRGPATRRLPASAPVYAVERRHTSLSPLTLGWSPSMLIFPSEQERARTCSKSRKTAVHNVACMFLSGEFVTGVTYSDDQSFAFNENIWNLDGGYLPLV
ncbi:hypothetical protein B0H13DRAFT_1852125 [Mycena leptocephala]|nr:hypothetical protein B0H13DRAFT_1852125 [Mycena leptocephala]